VRNTFTTFCALFGAVGCGVQSIDMPLSPSSAPQSQNVKPVLFADTEPLIKKYCAEGCHTPSAPDFGQKSVLLDSLSNIQKTSAVRMADLVSLGAFQDSLKKTMPPRNSGRVDTMSPQNRVDLESWFRSSKELATGPIVTGVTKETYATVKNLFEVNCANGCHSGKNPIKGAGFESLEAIKASVKKYNAAFVSSTISGGSMPKRGDPRANSLTEANRARMTEWLLNSAELK
jgi:hypothetical protein